MEVVGNGSPNVAHSALLLRASNSNRYTRRLEMLVSRSKQRIVHLSNRYSFNVAFTAFFAGPEFLIAKMLHTARRSSPANRAGYAFLIANQTGKPESAKFAPATRRNCAKLSLFNPQGRLVPA